MAVAFRAVGATTKTTTTSLAPTASVATPAGFAAGDLLLIFVTFDCTHNPTTPFGWRRTTIIGAGTAGGNFTPATTAVYQRVADGTEGSSVGISFPTAAWPSGCPDVLAVMGAWTGCDPANPVETSNVFAVSPCPTAVLAHSITTVSTNGGWLVTVRGRGGGAATSFTDSVGTDVSRFQDTYSALSMGLFDSNAALTAGAQTQRTTTASTGSSSNGDTALNIALKVGSTASNATAIAGTAAASGAAYNPAGAAAYASWDQCTPGALPVYTWAVDWDLSGEAAAGNILSTNPYTTYDLTGWTGNNASIVRTTDLLAGRTVPTILVTPNGVSASGGVNQSPHPAAGTVVPGQSYIADAWVYSPGGWSDLRACIDWYDASDSFLSSGLGVATVVAAGTWTHLRQALTAPASASRPVARVRAGGTPASTNTFYTFGVMVMDPLVAEAQITPSPLDVIGDDMLSDGAVWAYGRDQMRPTSPAALGTASFSVTNANRTYSPDRADSPLHGTLDAARPLTAQVVYGGLVFPLFSGRIDDYQITRARDNRSVAFSFLDLESGFQKTKVTTPVYSGLRTGAAVNTVLDEVGWTGPRDIDLGATLMPWWWLDSAAAGDAINDLVKSEGPPAIFYIAPDGTAVFRDRTHRLLRDASLNVQGTYTAQAVDCASVPAAGLHFTDPFQYATGWRDIVNAVNFQVSQRAPNGIASVVWSTTDTMAISNGSTLVLNAVASDPFIGALLPVPGQDYTVSGAGSLAVSLGQLSGLSTQLSLTAVGGDVVVSGMQLQAFSLPVVSTVNVGQQDTASISQHGQQDYAETAPWAGVQDAYAISSVVLLRYAQRRPLVQIRVVSADPQHYLQVVGRTVSDLVHITDGETGFDSDCFVEHVAHTAQRMNAPGRPPVHSVVLGCEQQSYQSTNPFIFDQRGAGFDQGVWDPPSADNPATVFIFDDPARGVFDVGVLGT